VEQTYFTSDLHLQHRLVAGHRGFGEDLDAHDAAIAEDWDARVHPNDKVWVLGDVTVRATDYAYDWIKARPGRKHLVSGNHDGCHPMHRRWTKQAKKWLEVFETVQPLASVRLEGHLVLLSHFPYGGMEGADRTLEPRYPEWRPANSGLWLLHGHTHMADQRYHDRQIHIGLDAWGHKLVSQHEVTKLMRANP
jgi:calcineurin-like phosphoesterase family protein